MAVVAPLMARIVAGEEEAIFALYREFHAVFTGIVRSTLAGWGRRDLLADADEVEGLALTALLVVADRAGSWVPGGALPWQWATRAIRSELAVAIGNPRQWGEPDVVFAQLAVQAEGTAVPTGSVVRVPSELLRLADRHEGVRLLVEAARTVGSARDIEVHFEYRTQMVCGDPSPAVTVAASHGLSPGNVRQIDRRMRVKITALAARDARFSGLARLPWLAA